MNVFIALEGTLFLYYKLVGKYNSKFGECRTKYVYVTCKKNKNADYSEHPRSLISIFVICHQDSIVHGKTNKMACSPSEDAGQLGHPPILIRVLTVRSVGS